jgi:hypothetical protein
MTQLETSFDLFVAAQIINSKEKCYENSRFSIPVPPGTPSFLVLPGRKEEDGGLSRR